MSDYNPFKRQVAKIIGIDENKVLLRVKNTDGLSRFNEIEISPIDHRSISGQQRKMCWALIGAISEWSGDTKSSVAETMKLDFLTQSGEPLENTFSLSDAPMSVVSEYQRFLIDFIIENEVPTKEPLISYADDFTAYLRKCVYERKCCICGRHADIHHSNLDGSRVGMGRNREKMDHVGLSVFPLCRSHHNEIHTMPEKEFLDKYHLPDPVKLDETIWKGRK